MMRSTGMRRVAVVAMAALMAVVAGCATSGSASVEYLRADVHPRHATGFASQVGDGA